MAKVSGPLVSFGARGQLAKTLVFSGWKGIPTARQYVVPANPRTAGQVTQRGYMADAVTAWHSFTFDANDEDYGAWRRTAAQRGPMSGFNAFTQSFLDNAVAGADDWVVMNQMVVTDPSHASVDLSIVLTTGVTDNMRMHWGSTPGFQGFNATHAAVAGVFIIAALDTQFPAGTLLYFWFEDLEAGKSGRSGLYTMTLT